MLLCEWGVRSTFAAFEFEHGGAGDLTRLCCLNDGIDCICDGMAVLVGCGAADRARVGGMERCHGVVFAVALLCCFGDFDIFIVEVI